MGEGYFTLCLWGNDRRADYWGAGDTRLARREVVKSMLPVCVDGLRTVLDRFHGLRLVGTLEKSVITANGVVSIPVRLKAWMPPLSPTLMGLSYPRCKRNSGAVSVRQY